MIMSGLLLFAYVKLYCLSSAFISHTFWLPCSARDIIDLPQSLEVIEKTPGKPSSCLTSMLSKHREIALSVSSILIPKKAFGPK